MTDPASIADDDVSIDELQKAVEHMHGVPARFVEAVEVDERFNGEIVGQPCPTTSRSRHRTARAKAIVRAASATDRDPRARDRDRFAADRGRFAGEGGRFASEGSRFAIGGGRHADKGARFAIGGDCLANEGGRFAINRDPIVPDPAPQRADLAPHAADLAAYAADPTAYATDGPFCARDLVSEPRGRLLRAVDRDWQAQGPAWFVADRRAQAPGRGRMVQAVRWDGHRGRGRGRGRGRRRLHRVTHVFEDVHDHVHVHDGRRHRSPWVVPYPRASR